jgi:hypothetical protein
VLVAPDRKAQAPATFRWLLRPAAPDQVHDHDDDRDHEQNVNESAKTIGGDKAQNPKRNEDKYDCIKHDVFPIAYIDDQMNISK